MNENKNQSLEDELLRIKEEMNEIKELLKAKASDPEHTVKFDTVHGEPKKPPKKPKIVFSADDLDIDFDGLEELGETMNHYMANVLKGVEQNLQHSLSSLSSNFGIKMKKSAAKAAAKEAKRAVRNAERQIRQHEKRIRKKEMKLKNKFLKYQPLTVEELENFLDVAPSLAGSLADARRLMILKELETKPHYSPELADKLSFKGGALKNHLDNLIHANFISQEAVRGRYLITQLGMEALKLVEMLFRRHQYDEKIKSGEYTEEPYENELEDEMDGIEDEMNGIEDATEDLKEKLEDIEFEVDE